MEVTPTGVTHGHRPALLVFLMEVKRPFKNWLYPFSFETGLAIQHRWALNSSEFTTSSQIMSWFSCHRSQRNRYWCPLVSEILFWALLSLQSCDLWLRTQERHRLCSVEVGRIFDRERGSSLKGRVDKGQMHAENTLGWVWTTAYISHRPCTIPTFLCYEVPCCKVILYGSGFLEPGLGSYQ